MEHYLAMLNTARLEWIRKCCRIKERVRWGWAEESQASGYSGYCSARFLWRDPLSIRFRSSHHRNKKYLRKISAAARCAALLLGIADLLDR